MRGLALLIVLGASVAAADPPAQSHAGRVAFPRVWRACDADAQCIEIAHRCDDGRPALRYVAVARTHAAELRSKLAAAHCAATEADARQGAPRSVCRHAVCHMDTGND